MEYVYTHKYINHYENNTFIYVFVKYISMDQRYVEVGGFAVDLSRFPSSTYSMVHGRGVSRLGKLPQTTLEGFYVNPLNEVVSSAGSVSTSPQKTPTLKLLENKK
jgi:hypothetical protein